VAAGAVLFYPAASFRSYPAFLLALFVLAAGITMLQVAANPYVAVLGEPRTAASRLTLAQAFNSLGTTLAPLFGAALILPAAGDATRDLTSVQLPYLGIAALALVVAVTFARAHLPRIEEVSGDDPHGRVSDHPRLVLGAVAIFVYVGAEVAIGSLLVFVLGLSEVAGLAEQEAGFYVSVYWGAAMVGRFLGAGLQRRADPHRVLAAAATLAMALVLVTVMVRGPVGMVAILAVGFANSIMFPTIFAIAIEGLGPLTSRGSGLLNMAIVGGAVVPLLLGVVADSAGYLAAVGATVPCYGYILFYALRRLPAGPSAP
jgi:FHS family L-fucose permease-like MFS transporter